MGAAAVVLSLSLVSTGQCGSTDVQKTAESIVKTTGCSGGMCVILGGSPADLAVALADEGNLTVQALCADEESLATTRQTIREAKCYGQVSAELAPEGDVLPYVDRLLNLVVVMSDPASAEEAFRVLAPGGSIWVASESPALAEVVRQEDVWQGEVSAAASGWTYAVKSWPTDIDQWTHFLHDADGNPVAHDTVVGPPEHYQWISEPRWLRSHESDSSIKTMVTCGGRLFFIEDEAPTSLRGDHSLPDRWSLVARDAFNGARLWKVPIENYGWHAWKPSWFTPRPGDIPLNIQKCLIAVDDKVYASLGYLASPRSTHVAMTSIRCAGSL